MCEVSIPSDRILLYFSTYVYYVETSLISFCYVYKLGERGITYLPLCRDRRA
jgi:hypothetical protein